MKPRTRNERLVLELHKKLRGLTAKQLEYGWQQVPPKGYYKATRFGRGEVWCSECGTIVRDDASSLECSLGCGNFVCPRCGKTLELDYSLSRMKKTKITERAMVSYVTTFKGWQLVRTFSFEKSCWKRHECIKSVNETYENWFDPRTGHETIIGINYVRGINNFKWSYDTEWNVKSHNQYCTGYYVWNDVYKLQDNFMYPAVRVLPVLKRNGWTKRLAATFDIGEIFKRLINGGDTEWLIKTKQWTVLKWLIDSGQYTVPYKYSVKIARRAGYKIKDFGMWIDYLDLLNEEHKDLHNTHYICPADFRKEHNRLVKRKMDRLEQEHLKAQMKEALDQELNYEKSHGMFIGVHFDDGNVFCHVLRSVHEFIDEAKAMHHCVFANEYWNADCHPESLILSATDKDGARLETVEVDIKTWQIIQSRAKYNGETEQHAEILDLVRKNIPMLQKRIINKRHQIKR